ncbi:MAG: CHAT domain-containing protein [Gloeocapsa sp. DLM2.Bin57]|nr:MAG: CHAT domain-containing protein [Gloeocapsa sp. DLM2.Bin57]
MIFQKEIAKKLLIIIIFWLSATQAQASTQTLQKLWQQGDYINIINILEAEINNTEYDENQLADIYVYLSASYAELGRYSEAHDNLVRALAIYRKKGEKLKEAAVLTDLSQINLMLAKNQIAFNQSELALSLLEEKNHLNIEIKAHLIKGKALLLMRNYEAAFESYREAFLLGELLANPNVKAKVYLNFSEAHLVYSQALLSDADYLESEGFREEAEKYRELSRHEFEKAREQIVEANKFSDSLDNLLIAQIQLHMLEIIPELANWELAVTTISAIPDSVKKAELLRRLFEFSNSDNLFLEWAKTVSQNIGDTYSLALTLLVQSERAFSDEDFLNALELIQKAISLASETLAEDILYQAWFRAAELNRVLGKNEQAQLNYRRALTSLQSLRGKTRDSKFFQLDYEKEIEPIYRGYLHFLLSYPTENNLTEAVQVFELMQLSDLESFFGDRCFEEHLDNYQPSEVLLETNSVALYAISTESTLHILLITADGVIHHHTVAIGSQSLDEILVKWRYNLEDYATDRYLETSWWLYEKMIQPLEETLAQINPSAIVFIGDRFFRNVPLDALHNGEKFLIEKYPLVTTLGLQLTDFRELEQPKRALIFALTVERPPFSQLEFAQFEANQVAVIIPGAKKFLDKDFTRDKLASELAKWRNLSTVHLITHGNFGGTLERTFLQTYDNSISIMELEDLMTEGKLSVNLLVLSGCQTATGNSRSILGLAGVTVRGNVQSVVGSLWFVNDQETARLMEYFYQNLYGGIMSKAEALQQAKVELMQLSSHPKGWSAFILIGKW